MSIRPRGLRQSVKRPPADPTKPPQTGIHGAMLNAVAAPIGTHTRSDRPEARHRSPHFYASLSTRDAAHRRTQAGSLAPATGHSTSSQQSDAGPRQDQRRCPSMPVRRSPPCRWRPAAPIDARRRGGPGSGGRGTPTSVAGGGPYTGAGSDTLNVL